MANLKPCPFCGSDKVTYTHRREFGFEWYWIYCMKCGIRTTKHQSFEDAYSVWDTRCDNKDEVSDVSGGVNDGE